VNAPIAASTTATATATGAPDIVIRDAYVMTMDAAIGDLPRGDVHVRGEAIVAVEPRIDAAAWPSGARIIDGSGMILMPGLIDAHTHLWSSQMRGHFACTPERTYFRTRNRLADGYTAQDMYAGTRLGAAEALHSGITTVIDFCHNNRNRDFAEQSIRALTETGIRACFQYGASTISQPTDAIDLDHLAWLAGNWRAVVGDAPVSLGLGWRGPLGIVTITERQPRPDWSVARRELEVARAHGLPVAIHVSGVTAQRQFAALLAAGVLGPDIQLIHMTAPSPRELAAVAESGAAVALTPLTELRVGYGVTRLGDFLEAGVRLGLGIDSNSLAGSANLFAVMKLFQLIEAGCKQDELAIDARRLIALATIEGARSLGLDGLIGSITPGKKADLILLDAGAWNMGLFADDPAHLIVEAAGPANVDTVIVNGRVLKAGGRLTGLDRAEVMAAARASIAAILERVS